MFMCDGYKFSICQLINIMATIDAHAYLTQRILVVDDSELLLRAYTHALRSFGFDVDCAFDGVHGYNSFQLEPYDLVITDFDMPNLNGVEFFNKVRLNSDESFLIPFILITGTSIDSIPYDVAGFSSILSKPVGLSILRDEIFRLLALR